MNRGALILLSLPLVIGCQQELDPYDKQLMLFPRVEVHFNYPGNRKQTGINPEADDVVVQLIDRANIAMRSASAGEASTVMTKSPTSPIGETPRMASFSLTPSLFDRAP